MVSNLETSSMSERRMEDINDGYVLGIKNLVFLQEAYYLVQQELRFLAARMRKSFM